jgi:hypothetical protein
MPAAGAERATVSKARGPVVIAALVAVAAAVPWLLVRLDEPLARTGDAGLLALNLAIPLFLLAPFLAYSLLWRRMPREGRILSGAMLVLYGVAAVPRCLRSMVFLGEAVRAAAHVRAETRPARRAMRVGPVEAARRATAAGDTSFLGVAGYAVLVPGVTNPCVLARWGQSVIRGTSDASRTPGHARFQERAQHFAAAYNQALAARVGISPAELQRPGACTLDPRLRPWPAGPGEVAP